MLSIMHKKKQIKRLPGDNGRYEYYKWLPGEEKTVENAYKNHAGGGLTGTQRIMAYVGMNPGHNAREIARGTKMPIKNVAPRLTKLRDAHQLSRLTSKRGYIYGAWGETDAPKKLGRPKKTSTWRDRHDKEE